MFVKITASGSRRYVQLVESYRDDSGRVKKRTVATLGRLDQLGGELDSVINGLLKVSGRQAVSTGATPAITFESARALGDVWTLTELWNSLGFSELRRIFRRTRHAIDVEALIRVMVFNRLCDPDSKLGVLRWLETVALPQVDSKSITHQQLLRAMDALVDHAGAVDAAVAALLRPMIDQDLSVVFYDLTTIRTEGLSTEAHDVRQFGMAKEGVIARQFMLGVVQTAEGLPIYHEVFDGNAAETKTLLPTLKTVLGRFPSVRRLVLVADRGLLSLDNLAALTDGLVVTLASQTRPTGAAVAVDVTYLEDDSLREEQISVTTFARAQEVAGARQQLVDRVDRAVPTGTAIVARIAELFPRLRLGDGARSQIEVLTGNETVFRQLVRHLRALDEGACAWAEGDVFAPVAVSFSSESEATLSHGTYGPMREFPTPAGFNVGRWSLHTKLTGGNGARMYSHAERIDGQPVVLVGYFGDHLPTVRHH